MAYTGKVTPGGPADVRDLPALSITKLSVGPMDNNAYLLRCTDTGDGVLIDAANESARLLDMIGADTRLSTVVTTHRHGDHWQALEEIVSATGARSIAHEDDAAAIPVVHETLSAGATVQVGTCALEVIHLVGHTPGSIALVYQDPEGHAHLFTGDSLFPGGPGRTTDPSEFESLMDDLEAKVFARLPDDTWFYPGHGNDSTLGAERASVPEWRARGW
jgi:glyoxylase-like metal-dependent hydrolase (beta-lactamase superfamily II)